MNAPLTRRRFIQISAAATGLALVPGRTTAAHRKQYRWRGVALGADAALVLYHEDAGEARRLTEACLAEVRRLERVFSLYRADSAICRLNRDGRIETPPPELVELLARAQTFSARTSGAFDVTVQPLWRLYAATSVQDREPSSEEIAAARNLIDYRAVDVSRKRIAFARPGMSVTLNGIAQGYVTDAVSDLLRRQGMTDVLVNMGEIRSLGGHPDGEPWRVALGGTSGEEITLRDGAVATSAGAGFTFGGRPDVHHLFDPATGRSAVRWQQISVIAANATTADALSTAFMSMAWLDAADVAQDMGCRVIGTREDGSLVYT